MVWAENWHWPLQKPVLHWPCGMSMMPAIVKRCKDAWHYWTSEIHRAVLGAITLMWPVQRTWLQLPRKYARKSVKSQFSSPMLVLSVVVHYWLNQMPMSNAPFQSIPSHRSGWSELFYRTCSMPIVDTLCLSQVFLVSAETANGLIFYWILPRYSCLSWARHIRLIETRQHWSQSLSSVGHSRDAPEHSCLRPLYLSLSDANEDVPTHGQPRFAEITLSHRFGTLRSLSSVKRHRMESRRSDPTLSFEVHWPDQWFYLASLVAGMGLILRLRSTTIGCIPQEQWRSSSSSSWTKTKILANNDPRIDWFDLVLLDSDISSVAIKDSLRYVKVESRT